MDGTLGIDTRWYAPLLRPVLSTVERALEELAPDRDPWLLPRTGLGGAVVLQVARGFGSRSASRRGPGRGLERLAVVAVEGYNHRLQLGSPTSEERARWLARDLRWARRVWQSMAERDEPTLTRVVERLFGPRDEVCDRAIPESVLFMRGAVATGVVLGEVPEPIHAALDEHVTWLGLSWEAHAGTLDEAGWQGALAAIGRVEAWPDHPELVAIERALSALAELPLESPAALFRGALGQAPRELPRFGVVGERRGWTPIATPAPSSRSARPARSSAPEGALERFGERWHDAIERAIARLVESGSTTLAQAAGYLQRQGGKRVRPRVTLAAAQACGGDPRRALPLAAAVEWLHQGTLVLDDIIDSAQVRRGHATLHTATSDAFATGVAVFVLGRVLRASQGMHADIRRHVVDAAIALVEGERLELLHTGDAELSRTGYYAIIEAKTARLFGCAAALGALCAEAPRKQVAALSRYGRELGLAFQIVDDLLDYEGDEATFGKRPGTDLRAAKLTLPLSLLRERLPTAERERLAAALGHDEELGWIQAALREHAIGERCRERAARHGERAIEALAALPREADEAALEARALLEAIVRELGARRC
ncbi:polyprenyl synthetase family protein [Nannocystaceae bacterium ST9]